VAVLFIAGLQLPLMPSLETVGRLITLPTHIEFIELNVGVICCVITRFNVTMVGHPSGVVVGQVAELVDDVYVVPCQI
jgi:hypothetical protein